MGELAEALGLSRPGVTNTVDRLVAEGLVLRERGGSDKRLLHARLTPAGRERVAGRRGHPRRPGGPPAHAARGRRRGGHRRPRPRLGRHPRSSLIRSRTAGGVGRAGAGTELDLRNFKPVVFLPAPVRAGRPGGPGGVQRGGADHRPALARRPARRTGRRSGAAAGRADPGRRPARRGAAAVRAAPACRRSASSAPAAGARPARATSAGAPPAPSGSPSSTTTSCPTPTGTSAWPRTSPTCRRTSPAARGACACRCRPTAGPPTGSAARRGSRRAAGSPPTSPTAGPRWPRSAASTSASPAPSGRTPTSRCGSWTPAPAWSAGERWITHPVRPVDRWVSVRVQAGNADDVLMRRLHGPDWRRRADAAAGPASAAHGRHRGRAGGRGARRRAEAPGRGRRGRRVAGRHRRVRLGAHRTRAAHPRRSDHDDPHQRGHPADGHLALAARRACSTGA